MTERSHLKFYADYYHELGLNISFISNEVSKYNFLFGAKRMKAPFYEWEIFQTERQSKSILNAYEWNKCFGIGVILGFNNIAAIDIDGCVNEEIVDFILGYLQLPRNYEWVIKSGSRAGYHIIFKTLRPDSSCKRTHKSKLGYYQPLDDTFGKVDVNAYYPLDNIGDDIMPRMKGNEFLPRLINENSFEKIEFKWKGHVVVPPSIHSSGSLYSFLTTNPKNEPCEINFDLLSELQILISGKYAQDSSKDGKTAIPNEENITIDGKCAVVIDCETNGLPVDFKKDYTSTDNWPRLLQISWLVCGINYPRGDYSEFHDITLNLIKRQTINISPKNFSIDPNGELIHGLDFEFLNNVGEELKDILRMFIEDVKKCSIIVGHNLSYDLNVIKSELLRCGIDNSFLEDKKLFCTMENSIDICKIGYLPYKFPSLSELFFYCFGKKISEEHNSIFDAFLAMKCFNKIGEIKGRERFEEYLNRSRRRKKEFDDLFEKLSGVEKLKIADYDDKIFYCNYDALNLIEEEDVLQLTEDERNKLYKRITWENVNRRDAPWERIIGIFEKIMTLKSDDLPF